jgi:tRNA nucleotidyltransferase/poly(A) polymerase
MNGQTDLAAGMIRFCTPQSPESDPLRTLRALRFRWKLGFQMAPDTDERIRACVSGLERVSVERIRDELFQLLAIPQADAALADCLAYGMGRWLVGVELPADSGAAEGVRALLALLTDAPPELARLLSAAPTPPRTRRELLLWAAALQPVHPPLDPAAAARYLALSSDERQILVKALAAAVQVRALVPRWPVAGRVCYRLFRSAGNAGPEAVLLAAAADGRWTQAHSELLDEALQRHFWPEPPLLTGIEVMQILDTKPGPRVGQALEEVEEARADGILHTKAEAVAWLRERCQPTGG